MKKVKTNDEAAAVKRRLGRFLLSELYLDRWEELLPLMGNFVVIETRYRHDLNGIEYLAYSPLFEPIPDSAVAPEYDIQVTLNDFAPATIHCKRIPS